MSNQKLYSLLGLAFKAGKVVSGEEIVLNEIRANKLKVVFIAQDASQNTFKKISDKCNSYQTPYFQFADRYQLGAAIGKEERVIVGINDKGFATKMIEMIKNEQS